MIHLKLSSTVNRQTITEQTELPLMPISSPGRMSRISRIISSKVKMTDVETAIAVTGMKMINAAGMTDVTKMIGTDGITDAAEMTSVMGMTDATGTTGGTGTTDATETTGVIGMTGATGIFRAAETTGGAETDGVTEMKGVTEMDGTADGSIFWMLVHRPAIPVPPIILLLPVPPEGPRVRNLPADQTAPEDPAVLSSVFSGFRSVHLPTPCSPHSC